MASTMATNLEVLEKCDICDRLFLPSMYAYHCQQQPHLTALYQLARSL
jgi:hypothetical protein